jgi:hypothetical protein
MDKSFERNFPSSPSSQTVSPPDKSAKCLKTTDCISNTSTKISTNANSYQNRNISDLSFAVLQNEQNFCLGLNMYSQNICGHMENSRYVSDSRKDFSHKAKSAEDQKNITVNAACSQKHNRERLEPIIHTVSSDDRNLECSTETCTLDLSTRKKFPPDLSTSKSSTNPSESGSPLTKPAYPQTRPTFLISDILSDAYSASTKKVVREEECNRWNFASSFSPVCGQDLQAHGGGLAEEESDDLSEKYENEDGDICDQGIFSMKWLL